MDLGSHEGRDYNRGLLSITMASKSGGIYQGSLERVDTIWWLHLSSRWKTARNPHRPRRVTVTKPFLSCALRQLVIKASFLKESLLLTIHKYFWFTPARILGQLAYRVDFAILLQESVRYHEPLRTQASLDKHLSMIFFPTYRNHSCGLGDVM